MVALARPDVHEVVISPALARKGATASVPRLLQRLVRYGPWSQPTPMHDSHIKVALNNV